MRRNGRVASIFNEREQKKCERTEPDKTVKRSRHHHRRHTSTVAAAICSSRETVHVTTISHRPFHTLPGTLATLERSCFFSFHFLWFVSVLPFAISAARPPPPAPLIRPVRMPHLARPVRGTRSGVPWTVPRTRSRSKGACLLPSTTKGLADP